MYTIVVIGVVNGKTIEKQFENIVAFTVEWNSIVINYKDKPQYIEHFYKIITIQIVNKNKE